MNQTELNQILEALKYVTMGAEFEKCYEVEESYYDLNRLQFTAYLGASINLNELLKVAPEIQQKTGYKINCLHAATSHENRDITIIQISFNK